MILLELGDGWAPVIVNDTEELHLMAEQYRIISYDDLDYDKYWIGGLGYDSLESHGYSEGNILYVFLCCGNKVL